MCEAWGIVDVEAADAGLPIADFDPWVLPDVVEYGRTGHFTSDQTSEGLADVMIEMLDDPERMLEMGRHAQLRSRQILDWPHVLNRFLSRVSPEALNGEHPPALTEAVASQDPTSATDPLGVER